MSVDTSIDFPGIAAAADLRALVEGQSGPPNRSRKFACPWHDDRTPSLTITPDGRRWKCWGCGASGDAIDWVARRDGCTIAEAARTLDPLGPAPKAAGRAARPPAPREPRPASPPAWHSAKWQEAVDALVLEAERTLWGPDGRDALAWLKGRGLESRTISTFRLGFLPSGGWTAPVTRDDGSKSGIRHERGILIPWAAPGSWYSASERPDVPRWCGANVRALADPIGAPLPGEVPKLKALRGSERGHAYPWPDVLPTQAPLPALLCEGEFDALLATQAVGHMVHVGTVGGASQAPHASALAMLSSCPRWLVATDADAAGREAAWAWREREPAKVRRLILPPGVTDLGELVEGGGDLEAWLRVEWVRLGLAEDGR